MPISSPYRITGMPGSEKSILYIRQVNQFAVAQHRGQPPTNTPVVELYGYVGTKPGIYFIVLVVAEPSQVDFFVIGQEISPLGSLRDVAGVEKDFSLRSGGMIHLGHVKRLYMEANGFFTLIEATAPKPGLSILPE